MLGRPAALVASVAFHAFAITAGGHAFRDGRATIGEGVTPLLVDIEVLPDPVASTPQTQGERGVEGAVTSHRHRYPVAPSHDARPHDPSIVHAPIAASDASPAAPNVVEASTEAPVRFTLPIGKAVVGAAGRGSGAEGGGDSAAITYAESQVNVPARLLSGASIEYPPEARAAQIEEDLVVELVIDEGGRVAQARSVSNAGHGLDGAAVDSVRRYRFSPALRQGRPVAVRMRWTVQFRLR